MLSPLPATGAYPEATNELPGERRWLLAPLAAAFLFRTLGTWGTFLVPDEAVSTVIAGADSLTAVYRLTIEQAHPPLYFFLLHLWAKLV